MNPLMNQPSTVDRERHISQIREILAKQESGVIAIPANPTPDAIASATAFYMALVKMGKNVSIVAETIPQSNLQGADKIKTALTTGGDNLIVSFPYIDGTIDKVDYHIDGDRFNLVIVPREGSNRIQPNDVQFSYTGGKVDFIITIDTPNLKSLGAIYTKNESKFSGVNIINIDRHLINNSYGTINVVSKSSSSTSELVMKVIKGLKVEFDATMATNLYTGILTATNNLTAYSVNAETYESIATLMRAGAQKRPMPLSPTPQRFQQQSMPMNQPFQPPQPMRQPSPMSRQTGISRVEKVTKPKEFDSNTSQKENPLKPKIFSGSAPLL